MSIQMAFAIIGVALTAATHCCAMSLLQVDAQVGKNRGHMPHAESAVAARKATNNGMKKFILGYLDRKGMAVADGGMNNLDSLVPWYSGVVAQRPYIHLQKTLKTAPWVMRKKRASPPKDVANEPTPETDNTDAEDSGGVRDQAAEGEMKDTPETDHTDAEDSGEVRDQAAVGEIKDMPETDDTDAEDSGEGRDQAAEGEMKDMPETDSTAAEDSGEVRDQAAEGEMKDMPETDNTDAEDSGEVRDQAAESETKDMNAQAAGQPAKQLEAEKENAASAAVVKKNVAMIQNAKSKERMMLDTKAKDQRLMKKLYNAIKEETGGNADAMTAATTRILDMAKHIRRREAVHATEQSEQEASTGEDADTLSGAPAVTTTTKAHTSKLKVQEILDRTRRERFKLLATLKGKGVVSVDLGQGRMRVGTPTQLMHLERLGILTRFLQDEEITDEGMSDIEESVEEVSNSKLNVQEILDRTRRERLKRRANLKRPRAKQQRGKMALLEMMNMDMEMSEEGFAELVKQHSQRELLSFVERLLEKSGLRVTRPYRFHKMLEFYNHVCSIGSYAALQEELRKGASPARCDQAFLEPAPSDGGRVEGTRLGSDARMPTWRWMTKMMWAQSEGGENSTDPWQDFSKPTAGDVAELSEEGYRRATNAGDPASMISFILRLASREALEITSPDHLAYMVKYYDGECETNTFDKLLRELHHAADMPERCGGAWVRRM